MKTKLVRRLIRVGSAKLATHASFDGTHREGVLKYWP